MPEILRIRDDGIISSMTKLIFSQGNLLKPPERNYIVRTFPERPPSPSSVPVDRALVPRQHYQPRDGPRGPEPPARS